MFRRSPVFLHVFCPKTWEPRAARTLRGARGGASERRGAPGFDQRLIEVSDLDNDRFYENECVGD